MGHTSITSHPQAHIRVQSKVVTLSQHLKIIGMVKK